jgi:penicillin-binding protein 1A
MRYFFTRLLILIFFCGTVIFAGLWISSPSANTAIARARLHALQHHINFPGPEVGRRFSDALVATEDHRFYSPLDPGLDPFAILRVIYGKLIGLPDQGGSTIEQQLAKMLYPSTDHDFIGTLEQIIVGVKLYFTYPRSEILSLYAETAYYGSGYYGLQSASWGYFRKSPKQLNWVEAATLAGVVNAPTIFDPRNHPTASRRRELHVISRLVAVGDLTPEQARLAIGEPLGLQSDN